MTIGVFDVATSGDDESRIRKQADRDKVAAAVYDVREKFGHWLFAAADGDGFDDRAKLSYVDICKTIEPHVHARKGVHTRVMKALKNEWRSRQAGEEKGTHHEESSPDHLWEDDEPRDPFERRSHTRQACWPGCHENEAHAKKFHKDKKDKKEAAAPAPPRPHGHGYPEWMDENDMDAYSFPQTPSEAKHDMFSELMQEAPGGHGAPPGPGHMDEVSAGGARHTRGGPRGQAEHMPPGMHQDMPHPIHGKRTAAEDGAFERNAPDHPEQHIEKTYHPHDGEKLIPEGNFDAYKDRVDQNGPEKVESHAFIPGDNVPPAPPR